MDNIFLKPACDAAGNAMVVPDEITHRPLKAEGEWKPMTMYWARRIRDLDVIPCELPEENPAAKPVAELEDPSEEPPPPVADPA